MGAVVEFPGNGLASVPRPRGESATIIILPVIHIEPVERAPRRRPNQNIEIKGE